MASYRRTLEPPEKIRIRLTEDQLQLAIEALKAVVEDCPDADWNRDVQALTDRLNASLIVSRGAEKGV